MFPVLQFLQQPRKESLLDARPALIKRIDGDKVVIIDRNPLSRGQSVYWNLTPGKQAPNGHPSIVGNSHLADARTEKEERIRSAARKHNPEATREIARLCGVEELLTPRK